MQERGDQGLPFLKGVARARSSSDHGYNGIRKGGMKKSRVTTYKEGTPQGEKRSKAYSAANPLNSKRSVRPRQTKLNERVRQKERAEGA